MSAPLTWSPEQDARLRQLRGDGISYEAIGIAFGRTGQQCKGRLEYLRSREGRVELRTQWSPEARAKMIELWLEGKSATQVARIVGARSRNAVIGIVHRAGIKRPEAMSRRNMAEGSRKGGLKGLATQRAARLPQAPKTTKPRGIRTEPPRLKAPKAPPPEQPILRCVPIESLSIPLMDLEPRHCRYPTGEDERGHLFCGQHKAPGSYCLAHEAIVYTPSKAKRKATLRDLERIARLAA